MSPPRPYPHPRPRAHQDVEAGGFEEGDLVSDGERGEAGELLGELHRLDDALGGQLAELVPQVDVQGHALLRAVVLWWEVGDEDTRGVPLFPAPQEPRDLSTLTVVYLPSWQSAGKVSWWALRTFSMSSSTSGVMM